MYDAEVKVITLPIRQWLDQYYRPEWFIESCKACPNYGRIWSCPPLAQDTPTLVRPFSRIHIVGVKVIYDPQTRALADTPQRTDQIRRDTYGRVKRAMLESLLEIERSLPGTWCIAAGECELCPQCSRLQGTPCRMPHRMRYSFSGLGLDLTKIAENLLEMPLLWQKDGLPAYNVAIGALLDRQERSLSQHFDVAQERPWQLLQEQILGVLNQMGCEVMTKDGDLRNVCMVDQATGEEYRLSFSLGEQGLGHMELENQTGSGRRMDQFSDCLRRRFPELTRQ